MAKRDDFELRVVESMKSLPARQLAKPARPIRRPSAPTPDEALEALRATKGAASVIKSVPMLERTDLWGQTAYWDVRETRGIAVDGVSLWDFDCPGGVIGPCDNCNNRYAYFAGVENLGYIYPPGTLTGQVWCNLDVPAAGPYTFLAQLGTYQETDYYQPDFVAVVECFIDSISFGTRTLYPGPAVNVPFVTMLSAGAHQFQIKQVTGGFYFFSLSAWPIPLVEILS